MIFFDCAMGHRPFRAAALYAKGHGASLRPSPPMPVTIACPSRLLRIRH
jgi:hypothetical protein